MKPNPRNFFPADILPIEECSEKTLAHLNQIVRVIRNKGVNRTQGFLLLGHRYRFALGAAPIDLYDPESKSFLGWPIVWVLDDDNYLNLTQ